MSVASAPDQHEPLILEAVSVPNITEMHFRTKNLFLSKPASVLYLPTSETHRVLELTLGNKPNRNTFSSKPRRLRMIEMQSQYVRFLRIASRCVFGPELRVLGRRLLLHIRRRTHAHWNMKIVFSRGGA